MDGGLLFGVWDCGFTCCDCGMYDRLCCKNFISVNSWFSSCLMDDYFLQMMCELSDSSEGMRKQVCDPTL